MKLTPELLRRAAALIHLTETHETDYSNTFTCLAIRHAYLEVHPGQWPSLTNIIDAWQERLRAIGHRVLPVWWDYNPKVDGWDLVVQASRRDALLAAADHLERNA